MLERLTVDDFTGLAGSAFHVVEHDLEVRLERVVPVMENARARLTRQPFSLFFRGPLQPHLPQMTYTLTNPGFDEPLTIFLVPVGRNADGFEYEAVFT